MTSDFRIYSEAVLCESAMMKGHDTAVKLRDAIDRATSDPKRRAEMYAKESARVAASAEKMMGDVADRYREASHFLKTWSEHPGPKK